jgi:N-acyl-L-homoserine lactone synthetase
MDDGATSAGAADGFYKLAYFDELARRVLARTAPVHYRRATSAEDRTAIFRLRYQAVIDRGWARPADLPDGLERDDDDDRAHFVGGWDGATLVAAARLIFPAPGMPLPVERVFGVEVAPRDRVAHVDRIAVARAHSDAGSRLLLGLIAATWLEMRARGAHVWVGIDSPGTLRLYRRLGFAMKTLGPPRRYWDEERYPVRADPATDPWSPTARLLAELQGATATR